jgi:hypothetical protein
MKIVSPPKLPPIEELVKLVTEKLQSGVMLSAVDEISKNTNTAQYYQISQGFLDV